MKNLLFDSRQAFEIRHLATDGWSATGSPPMRRCAIRSPHCGQGRKRPPRPELLP